MGINYSFERFKEGHESLEYLFLGEFETYKIIKNLVPNEKLILPADPGLCEHGTPNRVRIHNDLAYGYPMHDPLKNRIEDLPNKDYSLNRDVKFFSYTTTTQSALHICCYMGFSKIYLVGVDYKSYNNGQIHYDSKHDKNYGPQQMNPLQRHKEGDSYLIPTLEKKHNVKIVNLSKFL